MKISGGYLGLIFFYKRKIKDDCRGQDESCSKKTKEYDTGIPYNPQEIQKLVQKTPYPSHGYDKVVPHQVNLLILTERYFFNSKESSMQDIHTLTAPS